MGCWPKNGLLDMNKGLSLQHIGRPHSGIGQSLHMSPYPHAPVPWYTEGFCGSFGARSTRALSEAGESREMGWREGRVKPNHRKGTPKTIFRRRLGSGPWTQAEVPLPPAASLVGDVLRGVGLCQFTYPPWSWRRLFNIVSSLWPLNWAINGS